MPETIDVWFWLTSSERCDICTWPRELTRLEKHKVMTGSLVLRPFDELIVDFNCGDPKAVEMLRGNMHGWWSEWTPAKYLARHDGNGMVTMEERQ